MSDLEILKKLCERIDVIPVWTEHSPSSYDINYFDNRIPRIWYKSNDIEIGDFKLIERREFETREEIKERMAKIEKLEFDDLSFKEDIEHFIPKLHYLNYYQNLLSDDEDGEKDLRADLNIKSQFFNYPYYNPFQKENHDGNLKVYIDRDLIIKGLSFSKMELPNLPTEISQFKKLQYLNVSRLGLNEINFDFSQLKSLKLLDISYNQLGSLPKTISKSRLSILNGEDIHRDGKFKIDYELINSLPNLTSLNLSGNPIESLSIGIFDSKKLWYGRDELMEIRKKKNEVVKAQNYEEAAKLRDEEKKIEAKYGQGLILEETGLKMPPPIIFNGKVEEIKLFIKKFEGQSFPINEVKLSIVGDGSSGKTSLVKQLMNKNFDPNESQTHGIRIENITLQNGGLEVKVNIWDFGGQDIMHATHQFFLSKRSIYIIVADGRKDEDVEYWLNHVRSFGGGSPVLVVVTKIDENPGHHLNRRFLEEKYPNIVGFHRISNVNRAGIDELLDGIKNTFDKVEHLSMPWTKGWLDVKNYLEQSKNDYLDFENYLNLCSERGVSEEEAIVLIDYLNDLGAVIFFSDLALKDTNVINPQWITDAVYSIINHEILDANQGELDIYRLSDILNKSKYPSKKHNYIISLMKKFELCYQLTKNKVLIPALLGVEEPKNLPSPETTIIYTYKFLPSSIIANLIVRFNSSIFKDMKWRTGTVLKNDDYDAIVSIIVDKRERIITLNGEGLQRRELMSVVRFQLNEINKSFTNLIWEERIIVPNESNVSVSLSHLLKLESLGIDVVFPENARKSYTVQGLLGTIRPSKQEVLDTIIEMLVSLKTEIKSIKELEKQMDHILELKPNFMGLGINLNEIYERWKNRSKK